MKNDNTQLELLSETLHLERVDGGAGEMVAFTPRGLVFQKGASEADVLSVGKRLFAVRSYTKWALGSVFAAMMAKRAERVAQLTAEGRAKEARDLQSGLEWAGEFAGAHQMDAKEFREMLGVFTFYGVGDESNGAALAGLAELSFEHYREAMWGVDDGRPGGLQRALGYLKKAADGGWAVGQLRRHIRTSGSMVAAEPQEQAVADYAVIGDFRRWATRELDRVERYTPERAKLILDDLGESTLSYIDALRDITSGNRASKRKR